MSSREIYNAQGFGKKPSHLKENNVSYFKHWKRCMICSVVLFIHGWIPSFMPDYVSRKLNEED